MTIVYTHDELYFHVNPGSNNKTYEIKADLLGLNIAELKTLIYIQTWISVYFHDRVPTKPKTKIKEEFPPLRVTDGWINCCVTQEDGLRYLLIQANTYKTLKTKEKYYNYIEVTMLDKALGKLIQYFKP